MKKNEFKIEVTESKQQKIMNYLNDMQDMMERARDDNNESMMTAMAYRDGAIRILTMLGINYQCTPCENERGTKGIMFDLISKDIYAD